MRDPQRYYNKSLTELMLIIASNSRGGIIHEAGAIDDIQSFERNWARHNARVEVAEGALSGGKIQPKATPQQPTGMKTSLVYQAMHFRKLLALMKAFLALLVAETKRLCCSASALSRQALFLLFIWIPFCFTLKSKHV